MQKPFHERAQVQISLEEFITMRDAPVQRNTEKRAKMAKNNHLKFPSIRHSEVNFAETPDGTRYKLDGHTRALLWERGELVPLFDTLFATVYYVNSMKEIEDLYYTFDNVVTSEDSSDRLYGWMRQAGLAPQSAYIKNCKFTSVLETAETFYYHNSRKPAFSGGLARQKNVREMFSRWLEDIKGLDVLRIPSGGNKHRIVTAGSVAAMLVTFRSARKLDRVGPWHDFWRRFLDDAGVKTGKQRDAVQALSEYVTMDGVTAGHKMRSSNTYLDLCHKGVSAFDGSLRGKLYVAMLRDSNLDAYRASR